MCTVRCNSGFLASPPFDVTSLGVPGMVDVPVDIRIYPDPNPGVFMVHGILPGSGEARLSVVNVLGQPVYESPTALAGREFETAIHLAACPPGVYFLVVNASQGVLTSKFIIR